MKNKMKGLERGQKQILGFSTASKDSYTIFVENDEERIIRIGIKEADEYVKNESRERKINAPLSVEERVLLNSY
jgi:hypothetical protein